MSTDTPMYNFAVDGYAVGDRLLEGVMFDVVVTGDPAVELTIESLNVSPSAKSYFEQLNTAMWLQKVRDDVEDMLADIVAAGHGHEVLTDKNPDNTLEF